MAKHDWDEYLKTIKRLEPDIAMVDADTYHSSAAISLKRIADSLEKVQMSLSSWIEYHLRSKG